MVPTTGNFLVNASSHDDHKEVEWWSAILKAESKFEDFADISVERFVMADVVLASKLTDLTKENGAELAARLTAENNKVDTFITGRQIAWLILDWLRAKSSRARPSDGRAQYPKTSGLEPSEVGGHVATRADGQVPEGVCAGICRPVNDDDVNDLPGNQVGFTPSPLERGGKDDKSNADYDRKAVVPVASLIVANSSRKRNHRKRAAKQKAKSLAGSRREEDTGQVDTLDDLISKSNELLAQNGGSGSQPQQPLLDL